MRFPKRIALLLALGALLLVAVAGAVAASQRGSGTVLVRVAHQETFGQILVTSQNRALYYFTPEVGGKILCTGQCAALWPPLLVPVGTKVRATIAGVAGKFGVVVRPDGARQVTYKGRPMYTYVHDVKPLQVLCDGVGGWYVVRVRGA